MDFPKWVYLSANPSDGFIVVDQTELEEAIAGGAKLTPAPEAWEKEEPPVLDLVPAATSAPEQKAKK